MINITPRPIYVLRTIPPPPRFGGGGVLGLQQSAVVLVGIWGLEDS